MKTSLKHSFLAALLALGATATLRSAELAEPFRVQMNGTPIDVEIGHAAPLVADFDGDGIQDLLVGQFGGGKLRIYRNEGDGKKPQFNRFGWFQAGGALGTVPAS